MTSMSPVEALAALRSGGPEAAERARIALAAPADAADPTERERRTRLRAEVARLLAGLLRPGDRAIARWLLEREIADHEAAGYGASEALYTLIAAVARYADPDDALLIWRAHGDAGDARRGGCGAGGAGGRGAGAPGCSVTPSWASHRSCRPTSRSRWPRAC